MVGLDGHLHRRLTLPTGRSLDGPNAWSPAGDLLATRNDEWGCLQSDGGYDEAKMRACEEQREATAFVDASGRGAATSASLRGGVAGGNGVLGWTADREVLVLDDIPRTDLAKDPGERWLTSVSLDGARSRRLVSVPFDDNYGIGGLQVAAVALPSLEVRDAAQSDRGRWSLTYRVAVAILFAGAVLLVTKRVVSAKSSA